MELQSQEIDKIAAAMVAVQGEIGKAIRNGENPDFNSTYADLGSVWDACRDPLQKHGIAVIQQGVTIEGKPHLACTLLHESGQWIRGYFMFTETEGTAWSYGSNMSYLRRYSLASMAGIITADDDGRGAMGKPKTDEIPW